MRTSALSEVRAIGRAGTYPEIDEIEALVRGVQVVPSNRSNLAKAADQIGAAALRFLESHDGSQLAALDPLVSGQDIDLQDEDAEEDDLKFRIFFGKSDGIER